MGVSLAVCVLGDVLAEKFVLRRTTSWGDSFPWVFGDPFAGVLVLRRTTVGGELVGCALTVLEGTLTFLSPPRAFSMPLSEKLMATPGIGAA